MGKKIAVAWFVTVLSFILSAAMAALTVAHELGATLLPMTEEQYRGFYLIVALIVMGALSLVSLVLTIGMKIALRLNVALVVFSVLSFLFAVASAFLYVTDYFAVVL